MSADASVVSKSCADDRFGNDAEVVTKSNADATFGNDNPAMFVRVRKRQLQNGARSVSYDAVKAVRVNGKPRHIFICGLGSMKHRPGYTDQSPAHFWQWALGRMKLAGLSEHQKEQLILKAVAKGAPHPPSAEATA